MKFEEAIEKINDLFIEPCIPGYSSGDFAPEFSGQIEDLEEIIEELQATYAPKIKMTGKELDFLNSRFKTNDSSGSKVFIDANGRKIEISPRNLQAWLHPELIEVSDE